MFIAAIINFTQLTLYEKKQNPFDALGASPLSVPHSG